jgi:hypothetical protein
LRLIGKSSVDNKELKYFLFKKSLIGFQIDMNGDFTKLDLRKKFAGDPEEKWN